MSKYANKILVVVLSTAMLVIGHGAALRKASAPRQPDTVALGEAEVKQLLFLMDTDKNGKISKQEFMKPMEAEFDRLDKDKNGELDPTELVDSPFRPAPFAKASN